MSERHCPCGGKYHRHGKPAATKTGQPEAQRYICVECRKSITVRDGKIVPGRPRVKDWRCQP